jgi:predicted TPR repeat methyltransferase
LQAEAEGAWSRAARCWHIAGDHDRAAAAWSRRIAARADRQAARSLRSGAGNAQEADGILGLGSGRANPGGTA